MTRTEIRLTESRYGVLHAYAEKEGKTEDELATEVINNFVDEIERKEAARENWQIARKAAAGIWKDRDDLSDEYFQKLRKESNRFPNWSDEESE